MNWGKTAHGLVKEEQNRLDSLDNAERDKVEQSICDSAIAS